MKEKKKGTRHDYKNKKRELRDGLIMQKMLMRHVNVIDQNQIKFTECMRSKSSISYELRQKGK